MDKQKPIRILHVLTAMKLAGTETMIMNYYRNIDRSVIQFDFAVSATEACEYDSEIIENGGRIYHYPRYTGKNHFLYKRWWRSFFKTHPEHLIVHGHIGSTAAIYLRIAKKHGRYTIAHSHSTMSKLTGRVLLYKVFSYPTRFVADCFFGCSKEALIDRFGKKVADNKKKAYVIRNAIDVEKFEFDEETRGRIRQQYYESDETVVLGTVGRFTAAKNPFQIVKICDELKRRGVLYSFWWFGEGELENEIKKSIKLRRLEDRIKLVGTRPDIYNALQGMDIFIFPSSWEGLPVSCIEAQASGLITICSNVVSKEAIVASNLCNTLDPDDTSAWCELIMNRIKLLKSEKYRRSSPISSLNRSGFNIKESSKNLLRHYLSILNKM